jgi:uncharacterized membrane protein
MSDVNAAGLNVPEPQTERPYPKEATVSAGSTPRPNVAGLSDNAAGGLSYVTIVPAIVFLIIEPYKRSSFVRFHAWQSIFLYVAWALAHILVQVVQNLIPTVIFLTLTLWQLVDLAFFVVVVIVFVSAFNGKRFMLPLIGGLAEKQANR